VVTTIKLGNVYLDQNTFLLIVNFHFTLYLSNNEKLQNYLIDFALL